MDDVTAFERRLAAELDRMAGPGRRIDATALVRTAAAQSPECRFRTMLSATKLVTSAAVVAVAGALVLSGLVPRPRSDDSPGAVASPASTTTEALLSGMDTQEVEPGGLPCPRRPRRARPRGRSAGGPDGRPGRLGLAAATAS